MSSGLKHSLQVQKYLSLASRLGFFPGPGNGKEASQIIFLEYFGMCLTPPDTQNMKNFFLGVRQNFSKMGLEVPWFWFRGTRKRVPGTRFRDSFSVWYF